MANYKRTQLSYSTLTSPNTSISPQHVREAFQTQLPPFTALFWGVFCFSMIFAVPIPIIRIATTTFFAIPHILFSLVFLTQYKNSKLGFLLFLLVVSVLAATVWSGNWSSIYANFAFWLFNSYMCYKMLRHPHGRHIALHVWAFAASIIIAIRLSEFLFGLEVGLFNRNGYGFMITVFYAPLLWVVHRRGGLKLSLILVVIILITLLINASRSSLLISSLMSIILLFHYNRDMGRRIATLFSMVGMVLLLSLLLPTLTDLSPKLAGQVEWITNVIETGDLDTLREQDGKTITLRENLARKSIQLFEQNPYSGVGFGQYRYHRDVDAQEYLDQNNLSTLIEHNSYLLWLAETGLAGGIPLAFFIMFILWKSWQCRIAYLQTGEKYLVIGMAMSLAVCLNLGFLANITAAGTWVAWLVAVAFHDSVKDQMPQVLRQRLL